VRAAQELDAAVSVARRMRRSGDPLGALYEAVAALEAGDEPRAREAAAASRAPRASSRTCRSASRSWT